MSAATVVTVPADAVVVLDVDDTLYLERSYVHSGFRAVGDHLAASRGVDGVGDTLWAGFEAGVRGDAFDRALAHHGLDPDQGLVAELVGVYRRHRPTIEPLPDAARLLARLTGRPVAVITDGPPDSQRAKVDALGLPALADPIVVTGELGPGWTKPSPAPYERVEKVLGVAPERCWYLGDNPVKDFITPLTRGWTSVRVRRNGALHHVDPTPHGVVEVESFDQLVW